MPIEEALRRVALHDCNTVCVTGGEPLAQKGCLTLLAALCDADYSVSLETSGALSISGVDPRVAKIMDLKAPGSGESHRNRWSNLDHIGPRDELKFVLSSRHDYEWMRDVVRARGLASRTPNLLASTVFGALSPRELVSWVMEDALPVRVQLQMHKVIWSPDTTGV